MKKRTIALFAILLLPVCAWAQEAIKIDGRVEAGNVKTILAPHTGLVMDYTVREGDLLAAGETIFSLSSTPVYAEFDGTVTGLFAEAGDSAAFIQDQYGALCYMERERMFRVDASTSGADSDTENRIIHVGEHVFIESEHNNKRYGEAVVTGVDGKSYTLEVTYDHDLRLNEEVEIFRDEAKLSSSCIGTGRVRRIEPKAVTAQGYVRSVHVKDGQKVSRGDLLFEVVPDALPDMHGSDGSVSIPVDGVVLSVAAESGKEISKDAPMATYCERSDIQLVCPADEEDLERIAVGMQVPVTLDAYRNAPITGVVERIAYASSDESGSSNFDVIIRLEDNANVRIGMNATAEF